MADQENLNIEKIPIGNKLLHAYLGACYYAYNEGKDTIHLVARGNYVKKAIDIAAILIRETVKDPEYEVIIGS